MIKVNMTLGKKIICGVCASLLVALAIQIISMAALHHSSSRAKGLGQEWKTALQTSQELTHHWNLCNLHFQNYLLNGDTASLTEGKTQWTNVKHDLAKIQETAPALKSLPGFQEKSTALGEQYAVLESNLDPFESAILANQESQKELPRQNKSLLDKLEAVSSYQEDQLFQSRTSGSPTMDYDMDFDGRSSVSPSFLKKTLRLQNVSSKARMIASAIQAQVTLLSSTFDYEKFNPLTADLKKLAQEFEKLRVEIQDPENQKILGEAQSALENYQEGILSFGQSLQEVSAKREQLKSSTQTFSSTVASIEHTIIEESVKTMDGGKSALSFNKNLILGGLLCSLVVGGFLIYFVNNSVTTPLKLVTSTISQIVEENTASSNELSSSSQVLAESVNKQAASIEETTSSLEEISSMTKHTSDNANHTKALTQDARAAAHTGLETMKELNDGVEMVQNSTNEMGKAMDGIKDSSDSISNVIKTIDEIAFQTNILALNAAVEAARAGEAGMGFAVVADEVRALAQRSAEAAKETASLIQDSITKSNHGVEVCKKVNESLQLIINKSTDVSHNLQDITTKVGDVDKAACEIAEATSEQKVGIDHLHSVVAQMEQITQRNAASAEQTAAASTAMKEQTDELLTSIEDLNRMLENKETEDDSKPILSPNQEPGSKPETNSFLPPQSETPPSFNRGITPTKSADAGDDAIAGFEDF